jgi:hypothetical protein
LGYRDSEGDIPAPATKTGKIPEPERRRGILFLGIYRRGCDPDRAPRAVGGNGRSGRMGTMLPPRAGAAAGAGVGPGVGSGVGAGV